MQLSDRLLAIAGYINYGEKVADIGTDHGLLPIFLLRNNISKKVILSDVKSGPLKIAESNFSKFLPGLKGDLRLGCGISTLESGEVDAIVIAGMGGRLIAEILSADPEKTASFKKYILQPRNCREDLRIWLYKNPFEITHEKLVREGKYICEIIVAEPIAKFDVEERRRRYKDRLENLEFEISPLLFSANDPLLKEHIKCKIETEKEIISSIKEKGSGESLRQLAPRTKRVQKLEQLYKKAFI